MIQHSPLLRPFERSQHVGGRKCQNDNLSFCQNGVEPIDIDDGYVGAPEGIFTSATVNLVNSQPWEPAHRRKEEAKRRVAF